jgi:hypothetical protein
VNEDLLRNVMCGIDPARDLTDETLDDLVPQEQLMSKITAGIGGVVPEPPAVRTPARRRRPALVAASAAAAATVVAIAGALTFFSSAPVTVRDAEVGPHKSVQSIVSHEKVTTGNGVTLTQTGVVTSFDVRHDRYVHPFQMDDGALTVSPAPASMTTPTDASGFARRIWATSQLEGYSKQPNVSLGFGVVTITKHVRGVPVVDKVPAWVGLAYENAPYHCPMQTGEPSTPQLLRRAPYSGIAAVVVGQSSGSPAVIYIAKSVRCGRLYPAQLANALEQFSLPWRIVGTVGTSKVKVNVAPPPCGHVVGDAVAGIWRSGVLSSVTITEYGTAPEYTAEFQACPVAASVREVIDLRGPTSSHTRFVHPTTGPMTVVADSYK